MALLNLPDELLELIIAQAIPEGFEALAQSCKTIYLLCQPHIAGHNLLKRHFTKFRYPSDGFMPHHGICTSFDLLAYIANMPVLARYILEADFRYDGCYIHKRRSPDLKKDINNANLGGKVASLITSSRYLKAAGLNGAEYWNSTKDKLSVMK